MTAVDSIILDILPDGSVEFVGSMDQLGGELIGSKRAARYLPHRASHVEPINPPLRCLFHFLRSRFSEQGRVAAWTRSWPIVWRVNIVDGPILPGRYRDREQAIRDEVDWLQNRGAE